MVPDLTVLFITVNRMPRRWVEYHKSCLLFATEGYPIISISKRPVGVGRNLIDLSDEISYWNIYRQLLRGARETDTPFVAVAEDDTLYSREHFRCFRPGPQEVAYDMARWSVFAWDPIFCTRNRLGNFTMIAPREYLIDALQEREDKYPNGPPSDKFVGEIGRPRVDRGLKVCRRKHVEFFSEIPVVNLCHDNGVGFAGRRRRKAHGPIRADVLPYWGKAADIAREYNDA